MRSPSPRPLPKHVLLDLLPASFEPWGSLYPSRPPTPQSVRTIEEGLGVRLPELFIEIASACPLYGGWFGSIGDDFESGGHILSLNQDFRAGGMPARYVMFNHGHDGDCDAWDAAGPSMPSGEVPIVYFCFDLEGRGMTQAPRSLASSFAEYLNRFVREHASRCPDKSLRRRAKRILNALDGTQA